MKPLLAAEIKKRVREALKPRYAVECFYRGFNPQLDRTLERLARKRSDGSGMAITIGLRDTCFWFSSKTKALAAAKRLKTAKGVRVMLRSFERVP
jgi:hypothetical protein